MAQASVSKDASTSLLRVLAHRGQQGEAGPPRLLWSSVRSGNLPALLEAASHAASPRPASQAGPAKECKARSAQEAHQGMLRRTQPSKAATGLGRGRGAGRGRPGCLERGCARGELALPRPSKAKGARGAGWRWPAKAFLPRPNRGIACLGPTGVSVPVERGTPRFGPGTLFSPFPLYLFILLLFS